jgi:hypothetical protein
LSERTSLIEVIKKNVNFVIRSLEIKDRDTNKPLEYADEMKADMLLHIQVVPDFRRETSFGMTVRVQGNLTVRQVGALTPSFPRVEQMEDTGQYLDEIMAYAQQIVQAINKTTKHSV